MLLLVSGVVHENHGPDNTRNKSWIAFSLCNINIRSLSRSKLLASQTSLKDLYDVITMSETHLDQDVTNNTFKLQGFHDIIRKD